MGPYLRAIGAHRVLVIATLFAAILVSVIWLAARPAHYEASASLLVTPLPQEDETFLGLQLIRDSGDPTRTVQTAATLVDSPATAGRAAEELGSEWSVSKVQDAVSVNPEGESNVLAVTATAGEPGEAARVANVFARSALGARAEVLADQAEKEIARLNAGLEEGPNGAGATAIEERIDQLESLTSAGDPTLTLSQKAIRPDSTADTPAPIILLLAAIAGLALGSGGALALELTRRQLRDEDEMQSLYPLPVLARTPILKGKDASGWSAGSWHMPPAIWEACRALLIQLDVLRTNTDRAPVFLFTSASAGDGKTTSAINFALAAVSGGQSVALLDFDLRKPDVAEVLRITRRASATDLLAADASTSDLLQEQPAVPGLSVLGVEAGADNVRHVEELLRRLPRLIDEARESFDMVVIDSPPLGEISDALHLVDLVDAVLFVTRPGQTMRVDFEAARDLLERTEHAPAGLVVIGEPRARGSAYYDYASAERPLFARRDDASQL